MTDTESAAIELKDAGFWVCQVGGEFSVSKGSFAPSLRKAMKNYLNEQKRQRGYDALAADREVFHKIAEAHLGGWK